MSNNVDLFDSTRRNFGHALPGVLSWCVITLTIVGSLVFPRVWLVVATVVIGYFMTRMVGTLGYAIYGELLARRARATDWTVGEDEVGPDRPFLRAPLNLR